MSPFLGGYMLFQLLISYQKGKNQQRRLIRHSNARQGRKFVFQIGTENGSSPLSYNPELEPWTIVEI